MEQQKNTASHTNVIKFDLNLQEITHKTHTKNNMRNSSGITFILCLTFLACSAQKIDQASIQKTIKVLADDSMQGRGTGAEGGKMAATFIEKEFKKLALKPYGDKKSYQQAFPFKSGVHGTGEPGTSNNIVGFLDNGAENTVIIGAHYDHLGLGKDEDHWMPTRRTRFTTAQMTMHRA